MAQMQPVLHNWAFTNVNVLDYCFTWPVKNFSFIIKSDGESILSPEFPTQDKDVNWCVQLYPYGCKGDAKMDDIGTFLVYKSKKDWKKVVAKFKFSLLNQNQELYSLSRWSSIEEFSKDNRSWGFRDVIKRKKLFDNKLSLLPNDTFTIYCEIKMCTEVLNATGESRLVWHNTSSSELLLAKDYQKLWETKAHSDIVIAVNEKKLPAHKIILLTRSSVFKDLIEKCTDEKDEIIIEDFSYEVIVEVLRYMYYGKIENFISNPVSLLAAAKKYNLTGLELICQNNLINEINIYNAASMLAIASLHKVDKLKAKTTDFIISHMIEVMETPGYEGLKKSNPELVAEMLDAMVKNMYLTHNSVPNK